MLIYNVNKVIIGSLLFSVSATQNTHDVGVAKQECKFHLAQFGKKQMNLL